MTQPWRTVAEFREVNGHYEPFVWRNGKLVQVAWAPYSGSQDIFLGSPEEIVQNRIASPPAKLKSITPFRDWLPSGTWYTEHGQYIVNKTIFPKDILPQNRYCDTATN